MRVYIRRTTWLNGFADADILFTPLRHSWRNAPPAVKYSTHCAPAAIFQGFAAETMMKKTVVISLPQEVNLPPLLPFPSFYITFFSSRVLLFQPRLETINKICYPVTAYSEFGYEFRIPGRFGSIWRSS